MKKLNKKVVNLRLLSFSLIRIGFLFLVLSFFSCSTLNVTYITQKDENSVTVKVAKRNWKIGKIERWSNLNKNNKISRKHLFFNIFKCDLILKD